MASFQWIYVDKNDTYTIYCCVCVCGLQKDELSYVTRKKIEKFSDWIFVLDTHIKFILKIWFEWIEFFILRLYKRAFLLYFHINMYMVWLFLYIMHVQQFFFLCSTFEMKFIKN